MVAVLAKLSTSKKIQLRLLYENIIKLEPHEIFSHMYNIFLKVILTLVI